MNVKLVVGLAPAALSLLIAACGSSSKPDPYPDVPTFCSAVAKAICGEYTTCGVSQSTCEANRSAQCQKGNIVLALPGGSTLSRTYTSSKVQPCLDALNGA